MDNLIEQITSGVLAGVTPVIEATINKCLANNKNHQPDPLSDLVTIDVASDRTGKSKSWLYVCWPEVPGAKKHGKRIYFSLTGLAQWLNGEKNLPHV